MARHSGRRNLPRYFIRNYATQWGAEVIAALVRTVGPIDQKGQIDFCVKTWIFLAFILYFISLLALKSIFSFKVIIN